MSVAEVWRRARDADLLLLAAMTVVATAGYLLRAVRWRVLLLPAHPGVSLGGRWASVCIGFMVNNVLPVRIGEFARAYSLSRVEPVGVSSAFASLVVERVLDGLVLALFLSAAVLAPGWFGDAAVSGPTVRRLAAGGAAVFGAAAAALWLVARHPEAVTGAFDRTLGRVMTGDLGERVRDGVVRFCRGLGTLGDPGLFLRAVGWTLAIWLWLAASVWLGLLAFDIRAPGFPGAVLVQSVVAFAVALPSSPGFFGPFEAGARVGLALYGVNQALIVSFAMTAHVLTFLPVTLLGFWYLNRLGLRWADLRRSDDLVRRSSPEEAGAGSRDVAGP